MTEESAVVHHDIEHPNLVFYFNVVQSNLNVVHNNLKDVAIHASNMLMGVGDCISDGSKKNQNQNVEQNNPTSNESE